MQRKRSKAKQRTAQHRLAFVGVVGAVDLLAFSAGDGGVDRFNSAAQLFPPPSRLQVPYHTILVWGEDEAILLTALPVARLGGLGLGLRGCYQTKPAFLRSLF